MISFPVDYQLSANNGWDLLESIRAKRPSATAEEIGQIIRQLASRVKSELGLELDLDGSYVTGRKEVQIPDEFAKMLEDDGLSEEEFLINQNQDMQDRLDELITSFVQALG